MNETSFLRISVISENDLDGICALIYATVSWYPQEIVITTQFQNHLTLLINLVILRKNTK